MNAEIRTECQKESSCNRYCATLWHLRGGFHVTDCQQGMKPWSTILNVSASSCVVSCDIPIAQEIEECAIRWEKYGGMRKVLYLGICYLGRNFLILLFIRYVPQEKCLHCTPP